MKAKYIFKGIDVLIFENGNIQFGKEANTCEFIDDDLAEMSNFLKDCWYFQRGKIKEVKDKKIN